jgi:ribosome-associated toxin RatA of RatAB toxin-antitoxin module
MPQVALEVEIHAPARRVWQAVTDIERYPDTMANVRWVEIVDRLSPAVRQSAWSVILKGSILQWEEIENLDADRMVMEFHQVSGDLEKFDGAWRLTAVDGERTRVRLTVDFEIGIPLLADMLNPVAQRALRENCTDMLRGIERESTRR